MDQTTEEMARRVAESHAFENHVIKEEQFKDAALGPVLAIETREELKKHVELVLESKETLCFRTFPEKDTWRQADVFYHEASNTMVVVPTNLEAEPTAYRPEKRKEWFQYKVDEQQKSEGKFLHICHGIDDLRRTMEE